MDLAIFSWSFIGVQRRAGARWASGGASCPWIRGQPGFAGGSGWEGLSCCGSRSCLGAGIGGRWLGRGWFGGDLAGDAVWLDRDTGLGWAHRRWSRELEAGAAEY